MPDQHRTRKKTIKTDSPEVGKFAAYLDELIKARTSENKLITAAHVGKSKLSPYLEGIAVPDWRVLDYYILKTLGDVFHRPLSDAERETLTELHREACRVQPPRTPTSSDQVNFLEEDLALERSKLAHLTERLNSALGQNVADSEQIAQMRQDRESLRTRQQALTAQVSSLKRELEKSRQNQEKLEGASRKLAEFAQELDECQQKISALEETLSSQVRTSIELQKWVHFLQDQQAEAGQLFMRLVNHVANGEALARLSSRLERFERTVAQQTEIIMSLAETNMALERERDLVTQERDFLRAATSAAPNPLPHGIDPLWNGNPG